MATIDLKYGATAVSFEYDESRFGVLGAGDGDRPLTDIEIGQRLDAPIDSPPLEDVVRPGETVLFVVPDATRNVGAGQLVNLLVRRLIAAGTAPGDIAAIFATGIHRPVTEEEKRHVLTPFIAQRIKVLHHNAGDPVKNFRVGLTSGGIPVELNWAVTEYDHIVLVGGVTFHYFAGFTGGRKLICPGLASAKTASETHKLAFDCEKKARRKGVGTGWLDENAVHNAFMEAAAFANPSFCLSTIVNDAGEISELYCGDWRTSHRAACDAYAAAHSVSLSQKRHVVVASCGGYPFDINMIQAHKTVEAASHACADGGTIILLAECRDGLGRADFLSWFEAENSEVLAERLCKNYQVNGQTAWSLLKKAERFNISVLSSLDANTLNAMRLGKTGALSEVAGDLVSGDGYIIPSGARTNFV